jgi:hypothetical protein
LNLSIAERLGVKLFTANFCFHGSAGHLAVAVRYEQDVSQGY